jgi:hypothetical protein
MGIVGGSWIVGSSALPQKSRAILLTGRVAAGYAGFQS